MALVEVKVPDIGDFKEVEVIELLVKPGDTIVADQSLLTVESDKASMEIPSSHGGVVKEIMVKLGDKVAEGTLVLLLETVGAEVPIVVPVAPSAAPVAAPAAALAPASVGASALAAAPVAAASGPVEVLVPDIGDFDEVAVIEVFVKPGDAVKVEQSLITVESDKASMEIPSSHAGTVFQVLVNVGDKVRKGSPIALLWGAGGSPAAVAPAKALLPLPPQRQRQRQFRSPPWPPRLSLRWLHCRRTSPRPPRACCRTPRRRSAASRANLVCRWPS